MTIAAQIIAREDLTAKERRDLAEFLAESFDWKCGSSNVSYLFQDGSQIISAMDEHLAPVEMIEV